MKSEYKTVFFLLLFSALFLSVSCNGYNNNKHKPIQYIYASFGKVKNWVVGEGELIPVRCTEQMELLSKNNSNAYAYYYVSMDKIIKEKEFLDDNINSMPKDLKVIYKHQLSSKVDAICTRIHSEYYRIHKLNS